MGWLKVALTQSKRTPARWLAPIVAVGVVANILLRDTAVLHEMRWSVYSAHFATVLLAPIVAGVSCVEGINLSRAREMTGARGTTLRLMTSSWASVLVWIAVGYLTGIASVVIAVRAYGTPSLPSPCLLLTIFPALAFMSAAAAIGLAAGWWTESHLVVGLVSVFVFAATIGLYILSPTIVRVGGATASLVSLEPNPPVSFGLFVLYSSLACAAIVSTMHRSAIKLGLLAGHSALALVLVALLSNADTFRPVAEAVTCTSQHPSICLTNEYELYRSDLQHAVTVLLGQLDPPRWATPTRLSQDGTDSGMGVGFIPALHQFSSDPSIPVIGAFVNSYLSSCSDPFDDANFAASVTVIEWIQQGALGMQPGEDEVSRVAAVGAIRQLRQCQP